MPRFQKQKDGSLLPVFVSSNVDKISLIDQNPCMMLEKWGNLTLWACLYSKDEINDRIRSVQESKFGGIDTFIITNSQGESIITAHQSLYSPVGPSMEISVDDKPYLLGITDDTNIFFELYNITVQSKIDKNIPNRDHTKSPLAYII